MSITIEVAILNYNTPFFANTSNIKNFEITVCANIQFAAYAETCIFFLIK